MHIGHCSNACLFGSHKCESAFFNGHCVWGDIDAYNANWND